MKPVDMVLLALALAAPMPALAQEPDIVVRGQSDRAEIERILNADNLDTAHLSARDVAEIMAGIARGHAPEDFWDAYERHVQAWANLADAEDHARPRDDGSTFVDNPEQLEVAEAAIGTTFDEVERVARRYGAHLPRPLIDTTRIA